MKSSIALRALVAAAALAASACSTPATVSQTFNFARPADIALVCLDVQTARDGRIPPNARVTPQPLSACQTSSTNRPLRELIEDATGVHGMRLFALVPQSDRGELAVVNLHPEYDTGIVDNVRSIPGYTFIPVGSSPGAVAVDPRGTVTYVANGAENTGVNGVTVLDNTRLLASGNHRVQRNGAPAGQYVQHTTLSYPADVAVVQRGARYFLYVTQPARGSVLIKDVTDPTTDRAFSEVMLAAPTSRGGGLDGGTGAGLDGGTGDGGAGTAYPTAIAVADDGVMYIADQQADFVHVLRHEGETLVEFRRLESGIPTQALAVSPRVVATGERFAYVVGTDGSLIAMNAETGQRLNTNVVREETATRRCVPPFTDTSQCRRIDPQVERFDRIPLIAPARSVSFATRDMVNATDCETPQAPAACGTAGTDSVPGPRVLRGLHALVALRTGQTQVIDIVDPDRECRQANEVLLPPLALTQAHIPRQANALTTGPGLPAPPAVAVNGAQVVMGGDQPQLVPTDGSMTACNETNHFCIDLPSNGLALREEQFAITYQGVIPNLDTSGGDFQIRQGAPDDQIVLRARGANFCRNGAVAGDIVRLTTVGPSVTDPNVDAGLRFPENAECNSQLCLDAFGTTATPCNRDYGVVSATQEELVLRVPAPNPSCGSAVRVNETRGGLRRLLDCCYPQATRFQVRAGNHWIVQSTRVLYTHDVVEGPDGQCTFSVDPPRQGRATTGVTYTAPTVAFRIAPGVAMGAPVPPVLGTTITFNTTAALTPLVLDTATSPGAVLYSCPNQRVYVVDQGRHRLLEMPVNPIDTETSARRFN